MRHICQKEDVSEVCWPEMEMEIGVVTEAHLKGELGKPIDISSMGAVVS